MGRTRAGQPADDDGLGDLDATSVGVLLQVVDHQQPVDQELLDLIPRREAAQRTEPRLVVERVQQHGVGLAVDVVAEVVETSLLRRGLFERLEAERERGRRAPHRLTHADDRFG